LICPTDVKDVGSPALEVKRLPMLA
jgi:hypothetical protein